jgi:hypothetical protein
MKQRPHIKLGALHAAFLSILPRIKTHARIYFRNIKCPHKQDDLVAEAVALSWLWFRKLVAKGKEPLSFASAIATYAARAAGSGSKVAGMDKAKDVMNPLTQQRRGFVVGSLPGSSTLSNNPLVDALADNCVTPPDEQVCFRIDFPNWLGSLGNRQRRVAEDLMVGERTLEVADKHGISPARISQLRREFKDDWSRYCGDAVN